MQKTETIKITSIALVAMLAMFLLPVVSATIAQVTPATLSNQSASFSTNWTFANVTDGITHPISANSTFKWNATGSWVAVTKSGFTCTTTNCIATLDISSMGEGFGVLNFSAGNNTDVLAGTLGGVFKVDKTNPTVSISRDLAEIPTQGTIKVTWSTSDSGSGLSSKTMTITSPDSARCAAITSTSASGSQTLTGTQTACEGTYTASITSTDYSGLSSTSSVTWRAYTPDGTGFGIPTSGLQNAPGASKNNSRNVIVFVIIIGIVIFLLTRKKN